MLATGTRHITPFFSLSLLCRCSGSLRLLAEQAKRAEGHLSQSIHDCSFILWAMATTTAQTLTE